MSMFQRKTTETDFLTEFIAIYKDHPALWKIKSAEYSNRTLRNKGYADLLALYIKYEIKPANVDIIKRKINCLRTAFRREYKKYIASKSRIGAKETEKFESTLWYFKLLLFIGDNDDVRVPVENVDEDEEDDAVENAIPVSNEGKKRKVEKRASVTSDLLEKAYEPLSKEDDEFDIFGAVVKRKLQKMNKMQQLLCENLINQCLFRGTMNQLNDTTMLTLAPANVQQHICNPSNTTRQILFPVDFGCVCGTVGPTPIHQPPAEEPRHRQFASLKCFTLAQPLTSQNGGKDPTSDVKLDDE